MSNTDASNNNLRFNQVTEELEQTLGTNWVSTGITSGSGGTPAGSNTEIQFNDNGAFGASSGFTFDGADVIIPGNLISTAPAVFGSNTEVNLAANFPGSGYPQILMYTVSPGIDSIRIRSTGIIVSDEGNANDADPSAKLEVQSTAQGFLPPKMTTVQKNAIPSPATGLIVYDTDLNKLCVYTGAWETITSV